MKPTPLKKVKLGLCAIALGFFLASCGRNGAPLPPPGVSEDQAVPYLNEYTTGSLDANNSAADKQAKKNAWPQDDSQPSKTPVIKPPRPFFLDPLL